MIPGMNGVDLAIKFREELNFQETLVLISGIFKDKNFAKTSIRKANATDFLFKPLDLEKLLGHFFKEPEKNSDWGCRQLVHTVIDRKSSKRRCYSSFK